MSSPESDRGTHFIKARIDADIASGRFSGRVATRFPPEPNGYLHIGHAKSICLNFGLAKDYGGTCNLRFDDTNPANEDAEFVDSIIRDVRWLGFEPTAILHASDYYGQIYAWAEVLVNRGLAYVDDQSLEEIRATRGSVTVPGTPSPCRDRSPEENLRLLREMRDGLHPDGSKVLRAKIDMASPNMKMRDPLMYRIKRVAHHRTGTEWCIYPMYDWAHGQSDVIERITHSICTLEFENNRELYDWFLNALGPAEVGTTELPGQIEFARLSLTYTMMSKRNLKQLVEDNHVDGWDDPRMPTLAGLRRGGVTPEALRAFAEAVGMARANSTVDIGLLDHIVRDDLNHRAPRRMAVLEPLEVELSNWEADRVDWLDAASFPPDVGLPGSRKVPMERRLFIERSDFAEVPPPGFRRLVPGGEVRLRYGHVIRCDEVIKDGSGAVVKLRCSVDHATLGQRPQGRAVKGTIHWVPATRSVAGTVKVYDRLFTDPFPGRDAEFLTQINPNSLLVYQARIEPAVAEDGPGVHYQFERTGYFWRAPEDAHAGLVFNRTVALKDTWGGKAESGDGEPEAVVEVEVDKEAVVAEQARAKAEARSAVLDRDPAARAAYERLVTAVGSEDEAFEVARSADRLAVYDGAVAAGAPPAAVARWIVHALIAEAGSTPLGDLALEPGAFARLVRLTEEGELTQRVARQVLGVLLREGGDPKAIAEARGWLGGVDEEALVALVDGVLAGLPEEVARWRGGDQRLFGFFVGHVMKAAKGKAQPQDVQRVLRERLG
jgi:glutaminyl-tRNA synthetase